MSKKLAIIGASGMGSIIADKAREMGVETHCFAWLKGADAEGHADFFYNISVMEADKIIDQCRELGVDGVISTTELTILPAAQVASALGLIGNNPEVARDITDKFRNRKASENVEGLHHPKYFRVASPDQILSLELSFPVIVKPTSEGGKRGISVARTSEELSAAVSYARSERHRTPTFIVEEFLEGGDEYSVESLSYRGRHYVIQVTQKSSSGAPHCVELGHHQPAMLTPQMRAGVERVICDALTAIGVVNGPCHTEIKIINGAIYLIEFNARPGGDQIAATLTPLSTGFDYIEGAIHIALGDFESPDTSSFERNYASLFFVTRQSSWLTPIFKDCQKQPWCYLKHEVSTSLQSLSHNDVYNTNYFIYFSRNESPPFISPGSTIS